MNASMLSSKTIAGSSLSSQFRQDKASKARRRGIRSPDIAPELLHGLAIRTMDAGSDGFASVGVASILHQDGATTIACGLAACAASTLGKRVVLVDANLRSPALRERFKFTPGPGLVDVLTGGASLESALYAPPVGLGRLLVLPASSMTAGSSPTVSTGAMRDLIAELYGQGELLIFDTAPLHPYPDTTMLARHLDSTVVVLRAERSKWEDAEQAVQDLRDADANVLGAVLNRRQSYIPRLIKRWL